MSVNVHDMLRDMLQNDTTKPKLLIQVGPVIYGYTRVSTALQRDEGHSLESQRYLIKKYCKENNMKEPVIVTDEGVSGKNMKSRPNFTSMCSKLKGGDILISQSLSRVARSVKDIGILVEDFVARKIKLITLNDNLNMDTATGRLYLNMLSAVNQFEREIASERTSATLQSMKREGTLITKPSIGFKVENGKLIENPEEMKIIKAIVKCLYEDPNAKVAEICRILQKQVDEGILSFRKTKVVHHKTVSEIIRRHNLRDNAADFDDRTIDNGYVNNTSV